MLQKKWISEWCEIIPCNTYYIWSWSDQPCQERVGHGRQMRLAYKSNSSSLEDQGCSMDSPENQASPLDSMQNQGLPVNDASLESSHLTASTSSRSYFEDDCSGGNNTPTNSLEKRQSSSNSQDSDTEVSGLDLVRMIFQTLLLYDCTYQRSNSFLRWT